jgi:type II protein arginine methyltransferase
VDWDWSCAREPPFGYAALSEWYFEMLRDAARHDLYEAALQAEIARVKQAMGKCRVLDVGSGDGILSMMALRAGASAAVGVEVVTPIARVSEEVVAANRPSRPDSEAPIPAPEAAPLDIWCTDVRGVGEPPDDMKFNVLVSELMDASGLGENLVQLTRSARRRLCVPVAPVIPARLKLFGVLCEVKLPDLNGVNMDAFWPFWPLERMGSALWLTVDVDKGEGDFRILTEPIEMLDLELGVADVDDIPTRREIDFEGTEGGTANVVLWWFETQLSSADPSIVLTNAPKCVDSRHAPTCWGQAMAELRMPLPVRRGEPAGVTMQMPFGEYQLRFRSREESGAPPTPCHLAPPPAAPPYSEAYRQDMEAFRAYRDEIDRLTKTNRIGHTAFRQADVGAKCAVEFCAQCLQSHCQLFGVEMSTAARMAAGWYAVGGEGRM